MPEKPPDFLDAAIAAAEQKEATVEMIGTQLGLLGNPARPAQVAMPKDITDMEIINLMCQVAALGDQLRAQRPSSRLVLPNGARPS